MTRLVTEHPVAVDYNDHYDRENDPAMCVCCFRNQKFNNRLYRLFPDKKIKVLELGCADGAFVYDVNKDGHFAIGLEGSDWFLKHKHKVVNFPNHYTPAKRSVNYVIDDTSSWHLIPDNLFTCDVAKPYTLFNDSNEVMKFDVICAWEVMEHIKEEEIEQFYQNVSKHLADGGFFILSVSTQRGEFHKTVKQRPWWITRVRELGFEHNQAKVDHFQMEFIRGPRQHAPGSFILALEKKC